MGAFLLRRLLHTVVVLLGVTVLVFFLVRISGDPAALYLPPDATDADLDNLRREMGWDQPIYVQYGAFIGRVLQGDLGMSLRHREPALKLILERLPATLELTVVSFLLAIVIAVPVGILSAWKRNSAVDGLARGFALLGLCIPNFWLASMLIMVLSVQLQWLPAFGRGGPANLVMPVITLGLTAAATTMRLLRANVLEVLPLDYVRTARAKGVTDRVVVWRHVLRNAAIPSVTVLGLQLGTLLSGAVVTETVFAYPGIGRLAVQAIEQRDFALVQAFVLVSAAMFVAANLLVDLLYTALDPRIRY